MTPRLAIAVLIALAACGDDAILLPADPPRLSRIDPVASGADCAAGGTAVRAGIDDDRDGVLDDAEIDETRLLCGVLVSEIYDGDVTEETWSDPAAVAALTSARVVTGDLAMVGDGPVSLPRLEHVIGTVEIRTPKDGEPLPALVRVGGNLYFHYLSPESRITLGALTDVGGNAGAAGSRFAISLPVLAHIGGWFRFLHGTEVSIEVPALVDIGGDAELCDLDRLDAGALTRIGGAATLCVRSPDSLRSLRTIGGDLTVLAAALDLPALEELGGGLYGREHVEAVRLPRLIRTVGDLYFADAPQLRAIELPALVRVNGRVVVGGAAALETLDLRALVVSGTDQFGNGGGELTRMFTIAGTGLRHIALPAFDPRESSARPVDLLIDIQNNVALESIELPLLASAGLFDVRFNTALTALRAPRLERTTGNVLLQSSPQLVTLELGLKSAGGVYLYQVPAAAMPAFAKLTTATRLRVEDCGLVDMRSFAALSSVETIVLASNRALTSLAGMRLSPVLERLEIANNALTTLDGIQVPAVFGGMLSITDNAALTSIAALRGLREVGLWLVLSGNTALADLTGLEDLTFARRLGIHEQPELTSLAPLHALVTVGDLSLQDLDRLTSLDGLASLDAVSRRVHIVGNDALVSLHGLRIAADLVGALEILDNPRLASLGGLEALRSIGSNLTITGNAALADLDGLAALAAVTGEVRIEGNPALPSVAVEALLRRLGR